MRFNELTDEQWEFVKPLLPPRARTGRRRADDRMTINGILYVLTTGCRWMDMPKKYGDDSTANRRLKKWEKKGVWKKRLMDSIISHAYSTGKLQMKVAIVDSSDVAAQIGAKLTIIRNQTLAVRHRDLNPFLYAAMFLMLPKK